MELKELLSKENVETQSPPRYSHTSLRGRQRTQRKILNLMLNDNYKDRKNVVKSILFFVPFVCFPPVGGQVVFKNQWRRDAKNCKINNAFN